MEYRPPKYGLPVLRHPAIDRPSLLAQLAQVLQHKLTLVAAPPGYGKTTLVAQFAHSLSISVAWHTVEERERDLPNLALHCLEALSGAGVDVAAVDIQTDRNPVALANQVADLLRNTQSDPIVYVLDDIQNILGSPDAELWLQSLIQHTPPDVHFILVGRALPTLPTVELVARGEVLALGQGQLRFSFEEIQALAQQMGTPVMPHEVQNIMTWLDGWVAGSVLALQPLPNDIAHALFGERQGPEALFDSLAGLLLQTQDEAVQDFLLASSTLSRMTPTLCQEVLRIKDTQAIWGEVLHRHLFVSEVPAGLTYHPLFRHFLQARLQMEDPTRFVDLHLRAAHWFEASDQLEEAFDHYINARHKREAAQIADRAAGAYLSQGRAETVLYWRDQLASEGDEYPQLLFICAHIRVYRYQYDLAEEELRKADQAFDRRNDHLGAIKVKLAQANINTLGGKPTLAMQLTEDVLSQTDVPDNLRGYAHSLLGRAYQSLGDIDKALRDMETALPLYRATGDQFAIANLLLAIETNCREIGRFEESSAYLHEALTMLRATGNAKDLLAPLNNLGYSYHLFGEYEESLRAFQEGLEIAARVNETRDASYLYSGVADLHRDRGNFGEAIAFYQKALRTVSTHEPALRCVTLVNFATLRRWQDNLEEAETLAHEAAQLAEQHGLLVEKMRAQVCIAALRALRGEPTNAQDELAALAEALRRRSAPIQSAHAVVLEAYAALMSGNSFAAHALLKSATEDILHETILQPGVAEIVHAPLLRSFVQLHRLRYPMLLKGIERLEAAQDESSVQASQRTHTITLPTYSLRLWTLGQERIERDAVPVPPAAWRSADARELFFYLLLKGAATREQLGLVLWEDSSSEQLRGRFHAILHRARNAVGTNTIRFEDERYFINPDVDIWCDAIDFGALIQKARLSSSLRPYTEDLWRRAVDLYEGELLASFGALWIVQSREAFREMYLEALLSLGMCIRARGSFQEALTVFRQAVEADPYREESYRELMTCYAALGEQSAIRREMDKLTRLFNSELGIAPSVETRTLVDSLLA